MPHNPLRNWLEENQELCIDGYFTRRIANGEQPDNREPHASLPVIPAGASILVETGFLAARRAEAQKKLQKK